MKISNFKFQISKLSTGFTLVELLIVITIIGILATIGLTNYVAVLERGRDSQRKADLLKMQAALELYRSDVGSYPAANLFAACGGNLVNGSVTYLRGIPCDPKGSTFYNGGVYSYLTTGNTYSLTACIENGNDSDSRVTNAPPAGAPSTNCARSKYFSVYNP